MFCDFGLVATGNTSGGGGRRGPPQNAWKIEQETDDFHHKKIDRSFQVALQQARTSKNWSQKDLAQVGLLF